MLARSVAAVVQAPELGPLVARIPLAELVAQRDDALLGARLVLVAAGTAEDGVVACRRRSRRAAGRVCSGLRVPSARSCEAAVVDVVLHAGDFETDAETRDGLVAEREHLGEVVAGVDVQHREGHAAGRERLRREVEHDDGVLAAGEQQHGALELGDDLADDVDRLGLEQVEGGAVERRVAGPELRLTAGESRWRSSHRCSPHSVFDRPAQRPDRGSSPGATGFVHGSQPIEG